MRLARLKREDWLTRTRARRYFGENGGLILEFINDSSDEFYQKRRNILRQRLSEFHERSKILSQRPSEFHESDDGRKTRQDTRDLVSEMSSELEVSRRSPELEVSGRSSDLERCKFTFSVLLILKDIGSRNIEQGLDTNFALYSPVLAGFLREIHTLSVKGEGFFAPFFDYFKRKRSENMSRILQQTLKKNHDDGGTDTTIDDAIRSREEAEKQKAFWHGRSTKPENIFQVGRCFLNRAEEYGDCCHVDSDDPLERAQPAAPISLR
ncbi:MAG: hypothetical protein V3V61_00420 [Gammaproteobacteria bacterium]